MTHCIEGRRRRRDADDRILGPNDFIECPSESVSEDFIPQDLNDLPFVSLRLVPHDLVSLLMSGWFPLRPCVYNRYVDVRDRDPDPPEVRRNFHVPIRTCRPTYCRDANIPKFPIPLGRNYVCVAPGHYRRRSPLPTYSPTCTIAKSTPKGGVPCRSSFISFSGFRSHNDNCFDLMLWPPKPRSCAQGQDSPSESSDGDGIGFVSSDEDSDSVVSGVAQRPKTNGDRTFSNIKRPSPATVGIRLMKGAPHPLDVSAMWIRDQWPPTLDPRLTAEMLVVQRVNARFSSSSQLPARYLPAVSYAYFEVLMDPWNVQRWAPVWISKVQKLLEKSKESPEGTASLSRLFEEFSPNRGGGVRYRKLLEKLRFARTEAEGEGVEDTGAGTAPTMSSRYVLRTLMVAMVHLVFPRPIMPAEEQWVPKRDGPVFLVPGARWSPERGFLVPKRDGPLPSPDDAAKPNDDGSTIENLLDIVDSLATLVKLEEDKVEHDHALLFDDLALFRKVFGGAMRIALGESWRENDSTVEDELTKTSIPAGFLPAGGYEVIAVWMVDHLFVLGSMDSQLHDLGRGGLERVWKAPSMHSSARLIRFTPGDGADVVTSDSVVPVVSPRSEPKRSSLRCLGTYDEGVRVSSCQKSDPRFGSTTAADVNTLSQTLRVSAESASTSIADSGTLPQSPSTGMTWDLADS